MNINFDAFQCLEQERVDITFPKYNETLNQIWISLATKSAVQKNVA